LIGAVARNTIAKQFMLYQEQREGPW